MSLRIAVVTPRFHPDILGGAELHARWLAEHLSAVGHRVEVFTTCVLSSQTWENALPPGEELHRDVVVHRYLAERPDPQIRGELDRSMREGARFTLEEEEDWWLRCGVSSRAMEEELRRRREDLDVILALPYLAGTTYFAFKAVPDRFCLIPCLHDEPFARSTFTRRMLTQARGLLFNSAPERELAGNLVADLAPSAVVGLGFDPVVRADPESFRRTYHVQRPFVAFVGRLEVDKSLPMLIDYFLCYKGRKQNDLMLLLVGDGDIEVPASPDVRRLTIDWADRDAMFAAASILCQPSTKESFSIVMMQAWLCGCPVLVNARSAVPRYHCQQSQGGLWFENYPEFEAMLDRLLQRPHLLNRLGANGRAYVRREYGWPRVMEKLHVALREWGMHRGWTPVNDGERGLG